MAPTDARGNPSGSTSAVARDAVEQALWRMMSFYDTPLADLDAAIALDPAWALPHAMKAGFLLSLTEPALHAEAAAHLARAWALADTRTPANEQAHLNALQELLAGRWHAACRIWDGLLLRHPRDALALQWAHLWDFYRGDILQLRLRPARALPEWLASDPLQPYVLALHAFGLEENNLHPQAEDAGRQALAGGHRVPWAVHAVAHVMEMQGRHDEGGAWLRSHQADWALGNGFAGHLWWHKALFRLEALDTAGVLRLIDGHLSGDALQITLQRVDAAAMLWRLHLMGHDMSLRARELLVGWDLAPDTAGCSAFNDLHALLAMLVAGEPARAEVWLARCAARALDPEGARSANHAIAREAGLPLMRGLLAYGRDDSAAGADAAAEALYAARTHSLRIGGSHAQRDLIDQTLLAAAARGTRKDIGRALLNERGLAKPATPLTRFWSERVGLPEGRRLATVAAERTGPPP